MTERRSRDERIEMTERRSTYDIIDMNGLCSTDDIIEKIKRHSTDDIIDMNGLCSTDDITDMNGLCSTDDIIEKTKRRSTDERNDDVYAIALAKTLTKVSVPATVGLYSSCQDRIKDVLQQMEGHLNDESKWLEESPDSPSSPRSSCCSWLAVLWKLLFFKPILNQKNQNHHNIRFIHVYFSAWHFAGNNLLWAGMALRLFKAIQVHFGKFKPAVHRVAQCDEKYEHKKKTNQDSNGDWKAKKRCCCPLWLWFLFCLMTPLIVVVPLLIFDPSKFKRNTTQSNNRTEDYVIFTGLTIAPLGIPIVRALKFLFRTCRNFIISQQDIIKKAMNSVSLSSKLSFMTEVRHEIWFLSRFVKFMEVFERRRIRIVLQITNLDKCSSKEIVEVLKAVNILLSDEDSPFISILAFNPEVLVKKVENKARALLNQTVTLPLTIPPICHASRCRLFKKLACISETNQSEDKSEYGSSSCFSCMGISCGNCKEEEKRHQVNDDKVDNMIKNIPENNKLKKYFLHDTMSMRRVINSFRMVVIMKDLSISDSEENKPIEDDIAAWVILANHWPCRLSWIMQCVEDYEQRGEIDGTETFKDKTLFEVFEKCKQKLYDMKDEIREILELDGDPEMFEMFLKKDFQLKVENLERMEEILVNLDHSIKKEMGRIRSPSTLKAEEGPPSTSAHSS